MLQHIKLQKPVLRQRDSNLQNILLRLSRKYPSQQSQPCNQHTAATMCVWNLILAVTTILTKTIHSSVWSAHCQAHVACDWCYNDHDLWPLNMQSLQPNLTFAQSRFQFIFLWHAQNMTWLTKLLNGSVCTPRQFQCHVDSPPLVLHPLVCLEGDSRASSFWDNGHQLEMKVVWSSSPIKLMKWFIGMAQNCFVCGRCFFLLHLFSTHESIFLL